MSTGYCGYSGICWHITWYNRIMKHSFNLQICSAVYLGISSIFHQCLLWEGQLIERLLCHLVAKSCQAIAEWANASGNPGGLSLLSNFFPFQAEYLPFPAAAGRCSKLLWTVELQSLAWIMLSDLSSSLDAEKYLQSQPWELQALTLFPYLRWFLNSPVWLIFIC